MKERVLKFILDNNIKDEWLSSTNRYGEKVQYKRYWLE